MPYSNAKYVSHSVIINRLASALRGTGKTINFGDVIEWCQRVETEFCPDVDNMYLFQEVELDVTTTNKRVYLPCNIYRLLDVYSALGNSDSRVPYNMIGSFISLSLDTTLTSVYIDYYGVPIDIESGDPLIIRGHEDACFWYSMYMLYLVDILTDKISIDAKNELRMNKDNAILAAQNFSARHMDRNKMNRAMAIKYNIIPKPAQLKLIRTYNT